MRYFSQFTQKCISGLPLGQETSGNQEKSGKIKKKLQKSGKVRKKWGVLKKSQEKSGNLMKFKKKSDFVSLNLQNSLFSKAFKW